MNMKKTLAGVMAGAMAVSAMAATVSADQDAISLTYDLKTYIPNESSGEATYVMTYTPSTEAIYTFVDGTPSLTFGSSNTLLSGKKLYTAEVTVSASKHTEDGSAAKNISQTVKYYYEDDHVPTDPDYVKGTTVDVNGVKAAVINLAYGNYATGSLYAPNFKLVGEGGLGYTADGVKDNLYGFNSVSVKLTYEIPALQTEANYSSWSLDKDAEYKYLYEALGMDYMADKTVDLAMLNKYGTAPSSQPFAVSPATVGFTAAQAGSTGEDIYPMKTVLQPNGKSRIKTVRGTNYTIPAANDVIAALESRKAGGNRYTKPLAVINDAIANHDEVTFTFYSYDGYVTTAKSKLLNEWLDTDMAPGYKTSAYDWYNPQFAQHLYTNIGDSYSAFGVTDYDQYGSYSSAWGLNLFAGGIVVNNAITMQLNQMDYFTWGNNTLTFNWFDITDDGKITDAKTFLTSMLLYTPVDWYWDHLVVEVGGAETENVDQGEGADGEGDTIEDEVDEVVDEVIDEIEETEVEVTEEVVTEAEVVTEPDVVVVPEQTVPSPSTGNSPVALAVIPVALAAAAVVAKKRG